MLVFFALLVTVPCFLIDTSSQQVSKPLESRPSNRRQQRQQRQREMQKAAEEKKQLEEERIRQQEEVAARRFDAHPV